MMGLGLRRSIARRAREVQVRRDWLLAAGVALTLLPCVAAATQLIEQTQRLEDTLRTSVAAAEAATADPDREAGVGGRGVVTRDISVLRSRLKSYLESVEGGQGREETRPLFGRIESLVELAGSDFRRLPDYARYRASLEALEKVVEQLGLFYAEELEVRTPPDPIERP